MAWLSKSKVLSSKSSVFLGKSLALLSEALVLLSKALVLHNKMPYIWRFLKPKTRKLMIDLAKKPVSIINIPGHIFPDLKKHQTINSVFKNMTKKNIKRFYKLRKKYKDI